MNMSKENERKKTELIVHFEMNRFGFYHFKLGALQQEN